MDNTVDDTTMAYVVNFILGEEEGQRERADALKALIDETLKNAT